MKWITCLALAIATTVAVSAGGVHAETADEWIALGTRVHGAFGGFLPVGIRIGLDALDRLKVERRGVTITYRTGAKAPCPCIVDGVMLAAGASPGQGTVFLAPEQARAGELAEIIVANRRTGEALKYTIAEAWLPVLFGWNKEPPIVRFDSAMKAEGLFTVESVSVSK